MSGLPNKHTIKNWLKVLVPVILVVILGIVIYNLYNHDSKPLDTKPAPQGTVQVDQKTKQTTSFEYLPKSVDPTTGVREDTDVQFTSTQAPLVVNVNGKRHEVQTTNVQEEHKLDNGKLVVTEQHEAVLNLTLPEQPRFKKGVYVETDLNNDKAITAGARLSYQTEPLDIDLKADLYNSKQHMKRITLTATKWL